MPSGRKNMPPGPGRPKGSQNKSKARAQEAIANFIDENSDNLQRWLDEIAIKDGPKDAFNAFCALLEYHVPKLARVESAITGAVDMTHSLTDADRQLLDRYLKTKEEPKNETITTD